MEKKITKTNKVALASDAVNPILCGEFKFEKSNRSRISTFCLTYIVGTPLTFRNTTPSFQINSIQINRMPMLKKRPISKSAFKNLKWHLDLPVKVNFNTTIQREYENTLPGDFTMRFQSVRLFKKYIFFHLFLNNPTVVLQNLG